VSAGHELGLMSIWVIVGKKMKILKKLCIHFCCCCYMLLYIDLDVGRLAGL